MAYRKIYSQVALYASIAPSSGYHFIDYSGNRVNSQFCTITGNTTGYSLNSLSSIYRVFDCQYGFNESRVDLRNMGSFGTIARPIITVPPISLNFSYYSNGLINEYLLGFYLSTGVTPIYGFFDRTFAPHVNRDCKNFFLAVNPSESDLNFIQPVSQVLNGTTSTILKDNIYTYAFGDCYLNSYKYSASVGNFPQVTVDYTAYNVMYYSGGSGNNIPSVNPKDSTIRSGITYNLPPVYTGQQVSVIAPGDMFINISETGNVIPHNLPIAFNDIKIQDFDLEIGLTREPLQNLGYILPLDRRLNPPIYCNLSVSAIVGDTSTGSFINFINNDTLYNISINTNFSRSQPETGIAISFQFIQTKFNSIQIVDSVQNKRMVKFSLTSELNPNNNNVGFFISGQLGVPNGTYPKY